MLLVLARDHRFCFENSFVCVLQTIPAISITEGVPTYAISLSLILLFDAIVTAREDYKRHRYPHSHGFLAFLLCVTALVAARDDKATNTRLCTVLRQGQFVPTPSQEIVVGDIVKVFRGEEFPADLVFLAAAHPDPSQRSMCHVQVGGRFAVHLLLARFICHLLFLSTECTDGTAGW
jgi:hypothetical protein